MTDYEVLVRAYQILIDKLSASSPLAYGWQELIITREVLAKMIADRTANR